MGRPFAPVADGVRRSAGVVIGMAVGRLVVWGSGRLRGIRRKRGGRAREAEVGTKAET